MKLDQALKEGDEALEIYSRTPRGSVLVHEDALRALLAVAKAAVEYKRARSRNDGHDGPAYEIDADVERTELALFAAVRGADEGGNDGR